MFEETSCRSLWAGGGVNLLRPAAWFFRIPRYAAYGKSAGKPFGVRSWSSFPGRKDAENQSREGLENGERIELDPADSARCRDDWGIPRDGAAHRPGRWCGRECFLGKQDGPTA